jgi:hypothetical protein
MKFFATLVTAAGLIAASASAQTIRIPQDCRETLPAEVTVHLKPEDRSDAAIRGALRMAASLEAIQQTTGARIKSKSSLDLNSDRGTETGNKVSARFSQRMQSQAAGLVALTVLDEEVTPEQASLHAQASVCIPRDPAALKDTVHVDAFLSSRGEALTDGIAALKDVFSASRSFAMSDESEDADWVLSGRIDSVDVRPVTGTSIAFQRLQVSGQVEARNADGHVVTVKFDESRNIAVTRQAIDALNEWIPQLLSTASHDMEQRLVAERTGTSPQMKSQEPKW